MNRAIQLELELDDRKLVSAAQNTEETLTRMATQSSVGVRKLENAFQDMSLTALGVQGPVARIADALLEFVPGGEVGAGVLAGLAAIIFAFKNLEEQKQKLQEATSKLRTATDNETTAFIRLKDGIEAATKAQLELDITIAKNKLQEATDAAAKLEKQIRQNAAATATYTNDMGAAGGRVMTVAHQENALTQERKKNATATTDAATAIREANAGLLNSQAALNEFNTKSDQDAAKRRQDRINQLAEEKRNIEEATIAFRKYTAAALESAIKGFEERMKVDADRVAAMRKSIGEELSKGIGLETLSQTIEDQFTNRTIPALFLTADQLRASLTQLTDEQKAGIISVNDLLIQQQQKYSTMSLVAQTSSEAFQMLFEVIGQGGNALGNLGRGFARLTAGLAKTKAAENIAFAIENLAKAFGFIALGNVPSAGAAKAAAAGHFKAAAAWGVLGGGATAAAGGTSGPGGIGGGGAFSQSMVGQNNFSTQQPLTIVVQGGLLDMSNPETQRSFVSAMETVSNRRVRMVGA